LTRERLVGTQLRKAPRPEQAGPSVQPLLADRILYRQFRERAASALAAALGAWDPLLEDPRVTDAVRAATYDLSFVDRGTLEHQWRSAEIAGGIGARLRLPPARLRILTTAAILHDVGKLFVPVGLLHRPGPLSAEEHAVVRDHSAQGEHWLTGHRVPAPIPAIVRWHHERWDGEGYPDRLAGDKIPLESRILALADALDAMVSQRPYHCGRTIQEVCLILREESGHAFDPRIVRAALSFFD
jgi:two-component system response regulator RpfG